LSKVETKRLRWVDIPMVVRLPWVEVEEKNFSTTEFSKKNRNRLEENKNEQLNSIPLLLSMKVYNNDDEEVKSVCAACSKKFTSQTPFAVIPKLVLKVENNTIHTPIVFYCAPTHVGSRFQENAVRIKFTIKEKKDPKQTKHIDMVAQFRKHTQERKRPRTDNQEVTMDKLYKHFKSLTAANENLKRELEDQSKRLQTMETLQLQRELMEEELNVNLNRDEDLQMYFGSNLAPSPFIDSSFKKMVSKSTRGWKKFAVVMLVFLYLFILQHSIFWKDKDICMQTCLSASFD